MTYHDEHRAEPTPSAWAAVQSRLPGGNTPAQLFVLHVLCWAGISALAVVGLLLSGCTSLPAYEQASQEQDRAFVKPVLSTTKLLAGVGNVYAFERPATCGEKFPGQKKLLTISQGNPLVKDINGGGVWIPAGKRFYFSTLVLMDGFQCGQAASFMPEKNGSYEMRLSGESSFNRYVPAKCSVKMMKLEGEKGDGAVAVDASFRLEACLPPQ